MNHVRTCTCGGKGIVFKTAHDADAQHRFLKCQSCNRFWRTVEISIADFDRMIARAARFDRTIASVAAINHDMRELIAKERG